MKFDINNYILGVGEPIVDLINYMEKEHLRHCLPEDLSSGLASLPVDYIYLDGKRTTQRTTKTLPLTGQALSGKNSYKNMLFYFTTSDITPEEINKLGEKRLKELYSQVNDTKQKKGTRRNRKQQETTQQQTKQSNTNQELKQNEKYSEPHQI